MDTRGDEALAMQLWRAEEEQARQDAEDRERRRKEATGAAAAAGSGGATSLWSGGGAAASRGRGSLSSLDSLTPSSPEIVQLQHEVSTVLTDSFPHPDIHRLFFLYDQALFGSALAGVEVCWSTRMKLCAGQCSFKPQAGHCRVALSAPILQYRPTSDLLCTLLHELIHAFLFVGPERNTDHDDHGPHFLHHVR